ncbi:hypothetical protein [Pedosphaera parvula]|uniref:Uncharacterized protein n=1 Tax=Pedosphaera parvula (strain Ellin514) TaxID=320771 RepID=B9XKT6_PEDPL|nr:hypothetical protein [Pedosphaera parvula]EEF59579.1 hypothetical protein Cflav_PD2486 [Pedosphaera parvula Ellin514]
MQRISNLLTVAAAFGCLNFITITAHAQGSLTPPPGVPAPVMKSLDQIEARTPLISGAPGVSYANGLYTITQPGGYYLTGNLTMTNKTGASFITFLTNNVTLDLNGFTLFGTAGNMGTAIDGSGFGYRIFNGHIVGGTTQTNGVFTKAGFYKGIETFSGNVNFGTDTIISDITVRGVRDRGIQGSLNSVVERCLVDTAGAEGMIVGSVRDSRAINTSADAIEAAAVMNSVGKCVGTGNGISSYLAEPCNVQNSTGEAVSGAGIFANNAINCRGKSVSYIGLTANTALNCSGESTSGTGLSAYVANSCTGNRTGGTAIQANIGIACISLGGTFSITSKYNMP